MAFRSLLRTRRHTGANRCTPCAVVDVGVAVLLAGAAAVVDAVLAGVVLGVSLSVIYARGFLVPGTQWFADRVLPAGLRRRFGATTTDGAGRGEDASVEAVLETAGVVRVDGGDVAFDDAFRRRWRDQITTCREEPYSDAELVLRIGGIDDLAPSDVTVTEGGGAVTAALAGVSFARWESRGAFLADVAAAPELAARYPAWDALRFDERASVLAGVRRWLEWCPLCDGPVSLDDRVVRSRRGATDVVAGSCDACGRRMYELEA